MLLLTGILLAIAFILFSVQLAQVATLGQQAGREARNPVIEDYLMVRKQMQVLIKDEYRNGAGDVACPNDEDEVSGRVQSFLVMFNAHEQRRGMAFQGHVLDVDLAVANTLRVDVGLFISDGATTFQDSISYTVACV